MIPAGMSGGRGGAVHVSVGGIHVGEGVDARTAARMAGQHVENLTYTSLRYRMGLRFASDYRVQ